ncbi:MAG: DUF3833 family protein [Candidatus Nucleicultricaceae bacterium]
MKFLLFLFLLVGLYLYVTKRLRGSLERYKHKNPKLDPWKFFKGKLHAVGMIQDPFGRVLQSFDIDVFGEFTRTSGVMKQTFTSGGAPIAKRTWNFVKISDHRFEGCAPDVVGKARGEWQGNAIHMTYRIRIPLFGRERIVDVDDFLYAVNAEQVLNTAVFKKWGIPVARLYISFQKL